LALYLGASGSQFIAQEECVGNAGGGVGRWKKERERIDKGGNVAKINRFMVPTVSGYGSAFCFGCPALFSDLSKSEKERKGRGRDGERA